MAEIRKIEEHYLLDYFLERRGFPKPFLAEEELKASDSNVSKPLKKVFEKYAFPSSQLVMNLKNEYKVGGIEILKAEKYLKDLYL